MMRSLLVGLISVTMLNGVRSVNAAGDELREISRLYGERAGIGKLDRLAQHPGTAKRDRGSRSMHDIYRILTWRI